MVYDSGNMDRLLFELAPGAEGARAGGRTGTIKKRTAADDEAFFHALETLLDE